jgi:hypothetical protein
MKPVAIALILLLHAFASAQRAAPQRTLQSLVREHRTAIAKASQSDDPKDYDKAFESFITALKEYMAHEAKGRDVARARFELVHALMSTGKRESAEKALKAFDTNTSSAIDCAEAAQLAMMFRMKALAEGWIEVACAKKASTRDRMELGILLMSRLRKPKLATKLYDDALAAAEGDEAKAEVSWHRARATREREDIPEAAYEKALHHVAETYPKTRFGRIAGDRLVAMGFKVGGDPLPFTVTTLAGAEFELTKQTGKAVLVCFWNSEDPRSPGAVATLEQLHTQHAAGGLQVVGISVDTKAAAAREAAKAWKATFPQAHVPGGFESDLALRYRVEDTPHCFLLGRDGKFAGMNFALHDGFGKSQLAEAVQRALVTKGGKKRP